MHELSLDELRKIQIEILDVVSKFCDENEIKYWLDGGTLIGAVRHRGYIPWDDDIDLGMLRPDYDKFMKLFNENNARFKFYSIENNPKFCFAFGKVLDTETVLYEPDEKGRKIAVYIDIFVYDNAPDDDAIVEDMFNKREFYKSGYYKKMYRIFRPVKGNILKKVLAYPYRILKKILMPATYFPAEYFVRKIAENSRRYVSQDTKRVGNFMGWAKFVCGKHVFDSFVDVEFEGKKYKAPVGYDEWLRRFYGDYMQLPPVEERVTHHRFKAYGKD